MFSRVIRFKIWKELTSLIIPPLYLSPAAGSRTRCVWLFWMSIQILLGLVLLLLMCVVFGILPENHLQCMELGYSGCYGSGVAFVIFTVVVVLARLMQFTCHIYRFKHGIQVHAWSFDDHDQTPSDPTDIQPGQGTTPTSSDSNHNQSGKDPTPTSSDPSHNQPTCDNNRTLSELFPLTFSLLFSLTTTTAIFQLAHLNRLQLSLTNSTTFDIMYVWPLQDNQVIHALGSGLVAFAWLSFLIDYVLIIIVLIALFINCSYHPFRSEKGNLCSWNCWLPCLTIPIVIFILINSFFPEWHICPLFHRSCNELSTIKGIEVFTLSLNILLVTILLVFILEIRFDPHFKALGCEWRSGKCLSCFAAFIIIVAFVPVLYVIIIKAIAVELYFLSILIFLCLVGLIYLVISCAFVILNVKKTLVYPV